MAGLRAKLLRAAEPAGGSGVDFAQVHAALPEAIFLQ